jgi:hypothetical protein
LLATPITFVYATTTGEEEEEAEGGEDTTTGGIAASTATTLSPTGLPQTASDNQLTATLNGDNFSTGDEIVVTGTVAERGFDSAVNIQVIDPRGQTVHSAYPLLTG